MKLALFIAAIFISLLMAFGPWFSVKAQERVPVTDQVCYIEVLKVLDGGNAFTARVRCRPTGDPA